MMPGCSDSDSMSSNSIKDDSYEIEGTRPSSGDTGEHQGTALSGVITAGEWNDLENWSFWNTLIANKAYKDYDNYWEIFPAHRISLLLKGNDGQPRSNVTIALKKGSQLIWESQSDSSGKAELWINLFQETATIAIDDYILVVNGVPMDEPLKPASAGNNMIVVNGIEPAEKTVQIAFIVDATGSMGDEINFLKKDLTNVIETVKTDNPEFIFSTAAVFYRDDSDDYLVKLTPFTGQISETVRFIAAQSAAGGGDFPEAVDAGMSEAVDHLQWSETANTRIAFLILDAPPHYDQGVRESIKSSIQKAAKMGIKIIPITASGIDKETEFLMRFIAMGTGGSYVFITNDSGIGGDHIEASVGKYQVEKLNELMIRLINKYTK